MAKGGETKPEVTPGDKSSNTSSGMTGPRPAEGAEMGPGGGLDAFAVEDVATGDALTDEAFAGGTEGSEDLGFLPSLSLKTEKASSL